MHVTKNYLSNISQSLGLFPNLNHHNLVSNLNKLNLNKNHKIKSQPPIAHLKLWKLSKMLT